VALQFKVYEASSNLEDLGVISDILGKNGTVRFSSDRNLNSAKRVTLILQNTKGESAAVPCSSAVSNTVRQAIADGTDEEEILAALVQLNLLESEDGRIFISPTGSGDGKPLKDSYKVDNLKKIKTTYEKLERVF
jgi:hypothetical protein